MHTKNFSKKLLAWFHLNGRKDLPWQKNPTPYRVWISEIMLQQTQVITVIPYYLRFMKRFPHIMALANASLDEVLELWTGLGYYARARNLHKTARIIQEHYKGKFPLDFACVHALPGIGRSTAAAILALSSEQRLPILDGNVKRVLTRYFGIHGFPGLPKLENTLWDLSQSLLPQNELRNYTQAMMDLGATVCTRSQVKCEICPIHKNCYARKTQQQHVLPNKKPTVQKPTKSIIWIIFYNRNDQSVLLEKRPEEGIWGGLWSFPELRENVQTAATDYIQKVDVSHDIQKLAKAFFKKSINLKKFEYRLFSEFTHTFTHFHLNISAYLIEVTSTKTHPISSVSSGSNAKPKAWYRISKKLTVGIPAPVQRIFKELQCHLIPSSA